MTGATTPAAAAVAPKDRAATHAYLLASNAWTEAQLANLAQSSAAMEATASRIADECPGVLTGAPPPEEKIGSFKLGTLVRQSGRVIGEHQRESSQRSELQLELTIALSDSQIGPDRAAAEAFSSAVKPLRWSSPIITALVQIIASESQGELGVPTPNVCADMSSWVSSGYKTLSAGSKAFGAQTAALVKQAFELFALALSGALPSSPNFLSKYENAPDRALAHHTEALDARLQKASKAQSEVLKRLERTVGLPAPKTFKPLFPRKKPKTIARGRTAAGTNFVVLATPPSKKLRNARCTTEVSITESSRPTGGLLSILSGGSPERCLSRSHVTPDPSVNCNAGLLTVEASLLPGARSVRLRLSDGRTITSPAIIVPARLGGPAGLYYQVVRGPSPIPVSLTEFDGSGNTLTVLKLPRVVECTKRLIKFFPGGNVRLVHGSVRQGPSFTIRAEHFRELGQAHFELKFEVSNEEEGFLGLGAGGAGAALEEGIGSQRGGAETFEAHSSTGCKPQPYAIVYGLLKNPHDTVLAQVSGNLVPLKEVAIPARMHAGGVLAYGVFTPLPTALVTRNASGKTISTVNLSGAAQTTTETCEGEAEG